MPGLQQFSDNWKLERLPATCGCLCILLRIKEINTNLCYVNDSQGFGDESKWEQATIYRSNQSSLLVWVFPTTVGARVSHYLTFTLNRCQVLGCSNCIGHALNSLSTETSTGDAKCNVLNFGYVTKTLLSAKGIAAGIYCHLQCMWYMPVWMSDCEWSPKMHKCVHIEGQLAANL